MRPLREALITKDKRNWATTEKWPNPYKLTKEDQKGYLENVPLEIITLMLKEIEVQREDRFNLNDLQKFGLDYAFLWANTKDGNDFWESIKNENYQVFYDKYTPELLRKRLKE